MAIPKRKARRITVDGQAYRWTSKLKGVHGDLAVTVQHLTGEGPLLIVKAQHTDPYYRLSVEGGASDQASGLPPDHVSAVTRALVRGAILYAITVGWNPSAKDAPLVLRYEEGGFRKED